MVNSGIYLLSVHGFRSDCTPLVPRRVSGRGHEMARKAEGGEQRAGDGRWTMDDIPSRKDTGVVFGDDIP